MFVSCYVKVTRADPQFCTGFLNLACRLRLRLVYHCQWLRYIVAAVVHTLSCPHRRQCFSLSTIVWNITSPAKQAIPSCRARRPCMFSGGVNSSTHCRQLTLNHCSFQAKRTISDSTSCYQGPATKVQLPVVTESYRYYFDTGQNM